MDTVCRNFYHRSTSRASRARSLAESLLTLRKQSCDTGCNYCVITRGLLRNFATDATLVFALAAAALLSECTQAKPLHVRQYLQLPSVTIIIRLSQIIKA